MKTTFLCAVAALAAVLVVSATVWEGVTDVAVAKDLPRAYSIATNSFPRNTVVDVTNLENGKVVRVIVIAGLDTTGLLATLSRAAADAIDLRHDSTCRIRMTQPADSASHHTPTGGPSPFYQLGPLDASASVTPAPATESAPAVASRTLATESATAAANRRPATESATPAASRAPATESATAAANRPAATESAPAVASRTPATESAPAAASAPPAANRRPARESAPAASRTPATESAPAATESAPPAVSIIAADEPAVTEKDDAIAAGAPMTDNAIAAHEPAVTDNAIAADAPSVTDNAIATDAPAVTDNAIAAGAENPPEPTIVSGTLTLVPAEERIPVPPEQPVIASSDVASSDAAPRNVAPSVAAASKAPPVQSTETPAAYSPPAEFSPFQAPLISSLAPGKWYVQIGVYARPDNVEDEISRIGTAYPVAIQNIGTDTNPMFRVLLGPLNQGESGAMLQRFKSIGYADAFVRHN